METAREPDGHVKERAKRRLSPFARRLLAEWRRLGQPTESEPLIVAVSGGADSTALLLALDELRRAGSLSSSLTVAHLDHGLRGEAGAADARWVEELAARLGYEAESARVSVAERASDERDNLEQAARRARYEFLDQMALRHRAGAILTAHTMDDQAETVLLRLMRGSGAEGLCGIEPVRELNRGGGPPLLVRPLLRWARRADTEEYCRERSVEFRVDSMNLDERLARVRVRRSLLPLMGSFNGRVVEAIARTAELLREDQSVLAQAAEGLLSQASAGPESSADAVSGGMEETHTSVCPALRVTVLRDAPVALRRRALRLWIERGRGDLRRLELVHLRAVEALLEGERGGREALLPGGAKVRRKLGRLHLDLKKVEKGVGPV